MKKAILYARVSTDRQAERGYSREEQLAQMRNYCNGKGVQISGEYLEDYSAKNFHRPAFTKILNDIKSKKVIADIIVVPKIDRFTRNLPDTFGVIAELAKYKITVVSIAEGELDFNNPHKFFPLIIQTGAAQYDNMLRSDTTKRGMRQAMKNGKCVFTPPKGYVNNKLTKLIEIDNDLAVVVRWAFNQYNKGIYSAEEVRREAMPAGLKLTKQGFINMLRNPIYMGKILVPKTKEEPEELVDGLHEAIISEEIFYNVQQTLDVKGKPYKQPKDDIQNALPLRGHLVCPECGRTLTGSTPKGNGGKYPYYHCQQTKYGCKHRFSAKNAHSIMEDYLEKFQTNDESTNCFKAILADIFNTSDSDRHNSKKVLEEQINVLDKRINKIADDYADENTSVQQYNMFNDKFQAQKNDLIMQHATFAKVPPELNSYITYSCGLIKNISNYYTNSLPPIKHKLIGLIFPEKIVFTGTTYKTNKLNEVFNLISNVDKGLKENSSARIAKLYSEAPLAWFLSNKFIEDLKKLSDVYKLISGRNKVKS